MSSHHFVRENQEPAVFVNEFDGSLDVLGNLLEWGPLVVARQTTAIELLDRGIHTDAVLLHGNSVPDLFPEIERVILDKDEDLHAVLFNYLKNKAVTDLNYYSARAPERPEEIFQLALDAGINMIFFSPEVKKCFLTQSENKVWLRSGTVFSLSCKAVLHTPERVSVFEDRMQVTDDGWISFSVPVPCTITYFFEP